MCLAQGPQYSEAIGARTPDPSVSSQAFYHRVTALSEQAEVLTYSGPRQVSIEWSSIIIGLKLSLR